MFIWDYFFLAFFLTGTREREGERENQVTKMTKRLTASRHGTLVHGLIRY